MHSQHAHPLEILYSCVFPAAPPTCPSLVSAIMCSMFELHLDFSVRKLQSLFRTTLSVKSIVGNGNENEHRIICGRGPTNQKQDSALRNVHDISVCFLTRRAHRD